MKFRVSAITLMVLSVLITGCPTVTDPGSLSISPLTLELQVGQTATLMITSSEANDTFDWTSNNTAVATVSASGQVSGVAPGTARITATSAETGRSATATVTVAEEEAPGAPVMVTPGAATIAVGGSVALHGVAPEEEGPLLWFSEDETIATVTREGLVMGVGPGTVNVVVRGDSPDRQAIAVITVIEPVSHKATVGPLRASILIGGQLALTATSTDSLDDFIWSSESESTATVDQDGVVTGVGAGGVVVNAEGTNSGAIGSTVITVSAPVEHEVAVSPSTVTIAVGDTIDFRATTTREGDSFTWASENADIATINQAGRATGVAVGTVAIRAEGTNPDERGVAMLRVVEARARIATVRPVRASIAAGDTLAMRATSNDPTERFNWTSTDPAVATVDADGVVTGIGPGEVQVEATGMRTSSVGNATILVTEPVADQLWVTPSSATVRAGKTIALAALSTRSGDPIEWSSNTETVATVDGNGVVTGVNAGTAVVTATGQDSGLSADVTVTVTEPVVQMLEVQPVEASIEAGETISLSAVSTDPEDTFTWESFDPEVATVDAQGLVTGLAAGTAGIEVRGSNSGENSFATITVTAPEPLDRAISLVPSSAALEVGESVQLQTNAFQQDVDFAWTSADETIATVDATGLVTGAGAGEVTITAASRAPRASGTATITVTEPMPAEAIIRPIEASILVGEMITFTAESTVPLEEFEWSSSDESVATVGGGTGVATGTGAGTATITATGLSSGATSTSSVTVAEPVVHEVSVSPSDAALVTGDTLQLTASSTRDGDSFTWTSSNPETVAVDGNGRISGLAAGTGTITAESTVGGESDTAVIAVEDLVLHTVTVEPLQASIVAEETLALSAVSTDELDTFAWSSTNTAIATVNAEGVVTGVSEGTADIRVRGRNSGMTAVATIAVTRATVTVISVLPETASVEVAETVSLAASSTDPADSFTWTSENTAIATVDSAGTVTGVAVGSTTITATGSNSGVKASASVTVTDSEAPTISIAAPSVSATRFGPVTYKVTYEGTSAITLSRDDITVSVTGSVSALLGDVVTSGERDRTVNINTVSGDGTLSIAIAAGTATDAAGNLAPAAGPSAEVLVDNTPPTLAIREPSVSRTNTGPVSYRVSYAGADTISLTKSKVLVNGTGTVATTLADVATTGPDERTVTFASLSGDGTVGFSIAEGSATDVAGNRAPEAGPSTEVVVDNTPPAVTIGPPSAPVTNSSGPITFRVTYEGDTEIAITSYEILLHGSGTVAASMPEITETGENERTVTFDTLAGDGTLGISIAAGTATDDAGNEAPAAGPSDTVEVDNTAPTLAIGAPSEDVTSAGPVSYTVAYEGADNVTLSEADVALETTGSAGASVDAIEPGTDGVWTVTLGSVIGNGTVGISLPAGTATDAAGNEAPAAGPSATFEVNNIAPTLLLSAPSAANTFAEAVSYTVTYADADSISLAPGDVTLDSAAGVTADIAVTGTGLTERTITLSNFSGPGEVTITLAADTARNNALLPALAAGPSMPFRIHPLLEPGSGFTEPTPQPDPIGDPGAFGIDAKAIARWDVVPYQTFDGYFEIGVVAFHINNIDRVEFSVDDGPWLAVEKMTHNPRTDVVEYWVGLDARDFADGPIEVRAIARPEVGIPRVLGGEFDFTNAYRGTQWTGEHSLFLNTNAAGSNSEAVVEIPEGTYEWGSIPGAPVDPARDRWLELRPAEGAEVTIIPGLWHPQPHMIHLVGVNLIQPEREAQLRGSADDLVWLDGVDYTGPGQWERTDAMKILHSYWTDTTVRQSQQGHAQHFIRNCTFEAIGEDTTKDTYLIVGTSVENLGDPPEGLGWHPAVIGNPIQHDNRVYYELDILTRQKAWAFRNGTHNHWEHTDVAVVNCRTEKVTEGNQLLFLGGQTNHLLIDNCIWLGDESWNYRLSETLTIPEWMFTPHNVLFRNNNWYNDPLWFPNPTPLDGVTIIPIE